MHHHAMDEVSNKSEVLRKNMFFFSACSFMDFRYLPVS